MSFVEVSLIGILLMFYRTIQLTLKCFMLWPTVLLDGISEVNFVEKGFLNRSVKSDHMNEFFSPNLKEIKIHFIDERFY